MEPSTDRVELPGPRPRTYRTRRKRRSRRPVLLLLLALLLLGAGWGVKSWLTPEVPKEGPEEPTLSQQSADGSGEAGALKRRSKVYNFLLAATDLEGTRTDTMMVLSYDVPNRKVGVVSVPRDTLTRREKGKNPRLVYGPGGVQQRREDISRMLGIPIDFYVKVDIRGFIALVDELDGIDFHVPCDMTYDDPSQNLHISFTEGVHHLDGQQAMEVARFRKNNDGSGYSDVGRTQTQQQLLLALADKVISWGSLTRINSFVRIFNQYVETDLELRHMLYFAGEARKLDTAQDVRTATLEGRGDGIYRGTRYCYVLDEESTLETVNRLVNPYDRDLTPEEMDLLRPDRYMN